MFSTQLNHQLSLFLLPNPLLSPSSSFHFPIPARQRLISTQHSLLLKPRQSPNSKPKPTLFQTRHHRSQRQPPYSNPPTLQLLDSQLCKSSKHLIRSTSRTVYQKNGFTLAILGEGDKASIGIRCVSEECDHFFRERFWTGNRRDGPEARLAMAAQAQLDGCWWKGLNLCYDVVWECDSAICQRTIPVSLESIGTNLSKATAIVPELAAMYSITSPTLSKDSP